MERRRLLPFTNSLAAGLAIAFAFVTIIGLIADEKSAIAQFSSLLLRIVAVFTAFAIVSGIINLVIVHLQRYMRHEPNGVHSLLVVTTAIGVVTIHLVDRARLWKGDLANEDLSARLFQVLQISLEGAFAGMVFFFLIYAAYRLLGRQLSWMHSVFLLTIMVILLGSNALLTENLTFFEDFRDWLIRVPVTAGTRGLLIGIALGTVIVGVRVLIGQERAYREPTLKQ